MEQAVYCANRMQELGFGDTFKWVPLHIDNTYALHVAGNHTFSSHAKHVALRLFYIREVVQESKVSIHYVLTEDNISDLGTKFLNINRHRYLIGLIADFRV